MFKTPEVMRVYIGSFWNQPFQNEENRKLFEAEQDDLLKDLYGYGIYCKNDNHTRLKKNSCVRKVNELVKRARLARVHAYIIAQLKAEMPTLWKKEKKQV